MSEEPDWKDVNPKTENLPDKGRITIQFIVGGIALLVLTIICMRFRVIGLFVGTTAFITGIRMLTRRGKHNVKFSLTVLACGFFLLLAYPSLGPLAGFSVFFLIIGAIGLIAYGLFRAIKLAWDVGKW